MAHNFLVIMCDEISRDGVGCYGGPALTPNIDKLAAGGRRFTNAYTPSPICVPARAAFQSGQYVFQNRCWSNAQPYDGSQGGWAHRLKEEGHETVSIGKLHYRSSADDNGYAREIVPLHVAGGEGWVYGLLRREHHTCFNASAFAAGAGAGEDGYSDYDRSVRDEAVAWLKSEGKAQRDKPWGLFLSFLRPHYPLTCPKEFYDLYDPDRLPPIRFQGAKAEYRHPVLNAARAYHDYDDFFTDDAHRNIGRASYFGLCSFVDSLIGDVMTALHDAGLAEDTIVVFTADHGDMNGHGGWWTKMVMYEDSAGIPMIVSGPGISAGITETQASLVDVYPTALEACDVSENAADQEMPGRSLITMATSDDDLERAVFSEYHDGGSITGMMMLREGRWKYVAYPGFAPQLFDLEADPFEQNDLGLSGAHAEIRQRFHARMTHEFGDPGEINDLAFADQATRIEELGGLDGIIARENYDHTPVEGAG